MATPDMADLNREVIESFRAGETLPPGMHRSRLLLLTTTGARTGRERTTPMMMIPDGDRLLVVASNAGNPRTPDWYANLVAHPHVVVEAGDERYDATATPLAGEDRDRAWARVLEVARFFARDQERAGRELPVVALERTGG